MLFFAAPSWAVSMVFHVILLVLLALVTIGPRPDQTLHEFVMQPASRQEFEPVTEIETQALPDVSLKELTPEFSSAITEPIEFERDDETLVDQSEVGAQQVEIEEFNPLGEFAKINILDGTGGGIINEGNYSSRSPENRKRLNKLKHAPADIDRVVSLALKWIISRQAADGGWNFNHNLSANPLPCPNPGTAQRARNGATAIAILPLLGYGQTHKEGIYQKEIRAALAYLIQHMKVEGHAGAWHEPDGSMYSHGLAAIAMCEAYAMTHDRELLAPAQLSLNYIAQAQDPVGGGWRYEPRQAGDTSVVGWQLMALKSGHMAYLQVPKPTIAGASKFLDSVAADSGAQYGYTTSAAERDATTAIGLLCRMHLGWKREEPALVRGVGLLDQRGPSASDMYYNYYATQVCCHYDGDVWKRWNARMCDLLIRAQEKEGVKAGSWHMSGGHANDRGGRLYCTAMATMMLEVYFRQMPLYTQQAADDDFPL